MSTAAYLALSLLLPTLLQGGMAWWQGRQAAQQAAAQAEKQRRLALYRTLIDMANRPRGSSIAMLMRAAPSVWGGISPLAAQFLLRNPSRTAGMLGALPPSMTYNRAIGR